MLDVTTIYNRVRGVTVNYMFVFDLSFYFRQQNVPTRHRGKMC